MTWGRVNANGNAKYTPSFWSVVVFSTSFVISIRPVASITVMTDVIAGVLVAVARVVTTVPHGNRRASWRRQGGAVDRELRERKREIRCKESVVFQAAGDERARIAACDVQILVHPVARGGIYEIQVARPVHEAGDCTGRRIELQRVVRRLDRRRSRIERDGSRRRASSLARGHRTCSPSRARQRPSSGRRDSRECDSDDAAGNGRTGRRIQEHFIRLELEVEEVACGPALGVEDHRALFIGATSSATLSIATRRRSLVCWNAASAQARCAASPSRVR